MRSFAAPSPRSQVRSWLTTCFLLAVMLAAAVPPAEAASFGNFGSRVTTAGQDFNPAYAALAVTPTLCARDIGSTTGASAAARADDAFYLNMDAAGTIVGTFDVRLTTATGVTAGTMVLGSDADVGAAFTVANFACAAFEANVRFLEADGNPGWTGGDFLYWSPDTTLDVGDIRLAVATSNTGQESVSVTAGTVIALVTDADRAALTDNDGLYPDCTVGAPDTAACTSAAVLQGAGSFFLRWFDANLNGAFDTGDTLVLSFTPAATAAPLSFDINDVYLIGQTFGSRVIKSSADYLLEPELFTVAPTMAYARILGADSNCDRLWIHFRDHQGTTFIQEDDVVLYMPVNTLTTCTNPPAASSVTAGTRVTTVTSQLQGTAPLAQSALAALIFYVDANSNNVFDRTDPVYINKPTALGGASNALTVTAGDFRATSFSVGSVSFTAGSVVGGTDTDITTFAGLGINNEAGKSWVVRKFDDDGADPIRLQSLTGPVIYHDADGDTFWDPGTESVYLDVGTTTNGCGGTGTTGCVNSGDFLLHDGSDLTSTTPSTVTAIACPGPTDCAHTHATTDFRTTTDFRVTGTDATHENGRGENIYYSKDNIVNDEDFLTLPATGSTLAAGQVTFPCTTLCLNEGIHSTDKLFFSWCTGGACPGRLLNTDIEASPQMGTRITASGADFVPSLRALATAGGTLIRYNRLDSTSVVDDTFYLSTDGATVTTQDARMSPFGSLKAAGTVVLSSDTEEQSATIVAGGGGGYAALIAARDVDGVTGYSLGDPLYVDNPGGTMGGAAAGTLSAFDLRISEGSVGGFTHVPGSFVKSGEADILGGTAFIGLAGWTVGYFDDNVNGAFDEGDIIYGLPPGSAGLGTFPQPPLGAVRLNGAGGATGSGGTPPPPPPTPTPTPTPTPPPPAPPTVTPANFVATITVTPPAPALFQSFNITVTVQNTGTTAGTTTATLVADGQVVDTRTLTLSGGASQTFTAAWAFLSEGNHTLTVAGASKTINVPPPAPPPSPPPTTPPTTPGPPPPSPATQREQELERELQRLREEANRTRANTTGQGTPGFEPLAALLAVAGAVALGRRRRAA